MQKRINPFLSFLLAALLTVGSVSCSGGSEPETGGSTGHAPDNGAEAPADPDAPAENADSSSPAETEQPTPDYSDFVMPEETSRLVVYIGEFANRVMTPAIRLFEEMYPGVEVDLQVTKDSECRQKIRTEVAAGKGPDMFLAAGEDFPDIYKTMSTGILEDLNPYIQKDNSFNMSEYNEGVMQGGVFRGSRYILPAAYQFPVLLTSKEILEEAGIDPDSLNTYQGFIDACTAYHTAKPKNKLFQDGMKNGFLKTLFEYTGIRMIDYESNSVSFNEERFRQFIDVCKLYYTSNPGQSTGELACDPLSRRECLFGTMGDNDIMLFLTSYVYMKAYELTPLLSLVPDENDGSTAQITYFTAIPTGAANKLNGWRLIKILLSDEIQYGIDDSKENQRQLFPVGNPVRNESMRKLISYHTATYADFVTEEDIQMISDKTMTITNAVMFPTVIYNDVEENMVPYLSGNDSYDKCIGRLKNELELYASE